MCKTIVIAVFTLIVSVAIQVYVLPEYAPEYAPTLLTQKADEELFVASSLEPSAALLDSSSGRIHNTDIMAEIGAGGDGKCECSTKSKKADSATEAAARFIDPSEQTELDGMPQALKDAATALLEKERESLKEATMQEEAAIKLKPLHRKSSLREYDVTLWARRAERMPTLRMNNVTIVTHATLDRLPHLVRWCKSWRGPISVSIFVKPTQNYDEVLWYMYDNPTGVSVRGHGDTQNTTISRLDMECIRKHVDLHTITRIPQSLETRDESDMFTYYPFNVQRNTALDGTIGNWVFLLDIDFFMYPSVPSNKIRERKFSEFFHNTMNEHPAIYDDKPKALTVIPAVETVTVEISHPKNVTELGKAMETHEVCAFYGHYCTRCHLPTNLKKFTTAKDPYVVTYTDGYEPYIVAYRRSLPRYDEKFIGRGWDKMSYFYELNAQARPFIVLPEYFLMHSGRGDQPGKGQYTEEYMSRQKENTMLMHNFKAEMAVRYGLYNSDVDDEEVRLQDKQLEIIGQKTTGDPGFSLNKTDWSVISSSLGQPKACVSKIRGRNLDGNQSTKLRIALEYACSVIDCSPLRIGGLRYYPRNIVVQADWAFDRYYHEAVARGRPPAEACDFGGAAKLVHCASQCWGCMARPTASKGRLGEAIKWLCGPKQLENCPAILAMLPDYNRTTQEKAGLLFSFFYQVHRCAHLDTAAACFFEGAGMRVPCSRIPK